MGHSTKPTQPSIHPGSVKEAETIKRETRSYVASGQNPLPRAWAAA